DLWKIVPGIGAERIEDEDELCDPVKIAALVPRPEKLALVKGPTGRLIVYVPCSTCVGTGTYAGWIVYNQHGRALRPDWYPHETLAFRHTREKGTMPCPDCCASGKEPHWTDETVMIEPLLTKDAS